MPEHRAGLWKIDFTAEGRDKAREYARQASADGARVDVMQAGRYGWSAVGTHKQVIAVRDAVMTGGESFVITRAVTAELYPDGRLLAYEGDSPPAFREQTRARLGFDPAGDDRWEPKRAFSCPARILDVILLDPAEWPLRQL